MNTQYTLCTLLAILLAPTAASPLQAGAVDELQQYLQQPADQRPPLDQQPFATTPLSKVEAEAAKQLLWKDRIAMLRRERTDEWQQRAIRLGDKTLRFTSRTIGTKPKNGWNLYISLHGGGNTAPAVNDQQWKNQGTLYEPADSLYIAPRAPTDTWNLWHEPHIDPLLRRLIEDAIALGDVDPDRVYLLGYSAGGDGVYQLAPRMADAFAAAAMMAGHPNDASPLGLRNLPFTIHMGALDSAYRRNQVAAEWKKKLEALRKADPDGYIHQVTIHEGLGHWMERKDRVALTWMSQFTRTPLPTKIVWKQSQVPQARFYWLAVAAEDAKTGARLDVRRRGQEIVVHEAKDVEQFDILLNDEMLDLNIPVTILSGDKTIAVETVPRTIRNLKSSIDTRFDDRAIFSGRITVRLTPSG